MKLSILIPTLNEPESIKYLRRLRGILDPQVAKYPGEVEIKIHDAGRSMPTGTKRNELIANSVGEYFCQIDCDDIVDSYYVYELMTAIWVNPDVITFRGSMLTDGKNSKPFVIRKDSPYEERNGIYFRFANHLCCFKRSVVESVKFQPIWEREDYYWALEIQKRKLLKSEVHIERHMYTYDFKTNKPHYGSQSARLRR